MSIKIAILTISILLMGCSTKEYYTFGDNIDNIKSLPKYNKIISVEKVEIPKYLTDSAVVYQLTPYRVVRLKNANWLTPMKKRITNILINYLQKSLNTPNVYLYPWERNQKSDIKVSLKIKRFISYKSEVVLDARYDIKNLKTGKIRSSLFSTKEPSSHLAEDIMLSMERAYFKLVEKIKEDITKYN